MNSDVRGVYFCQYFRFGETGVFETRGNLVVPLHYKRFHIDNSLELFFNNKSHRTTSETRLTARRYS